MGRELLPYTPLFVSSAALSHASLSHHTHSSLPQPRAQEQLHGDLARAVGRWMQPVRGSSRLHAGRTSRWCARGTSRQGGSRQGRPCRSQQRRQTASGLTGVLEHGLTGGLFLFFLNYFHRRAIRPPLLISIPHMGISAASVILDYHRHCIRGGGDGHQGKSFLTAWEIYSCAGDNDPSTTKYEQHEKEVILTDAS